MDYERKLRTFYEKRMATEVAADALGEEWKVRLLPASMSQLGERKGCFGLSFINRTKFGEMGRKDMLLSCLPYGIQGLKKSLSCSC